MKNFFIADTHFGHSKIIPICNRPFTDVEDMEQKLVENWNCKVSAEDTVYILGDFCFKMDKKQAINILKQLNGNKILIVGNHDKFVGQRDFDECFIKIAPYLQITEGQRQIILCHYPIWDWAGMYYGSYHIYGHIHNNTMPTEHNAFCVSVEHINYEPVTLDELISKKLENK